MTKITANPKAVTVMENITAFLLNVARRSSKALSSLAMLASRSAARALSPNGSGLPHSTQSPCICGDKSLPQCAHGFSLKVMGDLSKGCFVVNLSDELQTKRLNESYRRKVSRHASNMGSAP
jgi:hypothetical protein